MSIVYAGASIAARHRPAVPGHEVQRHFSASPMAVSQAAYASSLAKNPQHEVLPMGIHQTREPDDFYLSLERCCNLFGL